MWKKIVLISKVPEESRLDLFLKRRGFYVSTAILIASLFYYLSYASYGFSEGDWGRIVVAAERSLQGDVFYRDFTPIYTPGIYFYTALAFKLFGVSLLSATAAWSIIRAFNCLLIYLIGIKFMSRRIAFLLPLILWFAPGPLHKSFLVFFELVHLLIFLRLMSTNSKGFYFFSGIMAGISLIFRIDLFTFFVIIIVLIELLKIIERCKEISVISSITVSFKNSPFFLAGAILAISPLVLYLYLNSAMPDAISQTLQFANLSKPNLFLLPPIKEIFSWDKWGFVNYAVLFIPLAIYSLSLGVIFFDIKNNKFTAEDKRLLILIIYGFLFLHQITRSPWIGGLYQVLPPILIINMYLFTRYSINMAGKHLEKLRLIYPVTLAIVNSTLVSLMVISFYMSDIHTNSSIFIRFTNTVFLSVPKVKVHTTEIIVNEFKRIKNIIESETEEGDAIFFTHHHPMYYFVTRRKNPTRYYFIHGYAGSDKNQLEIIKNLEDKKVKLIILGANHPYTPHTPIVVEYLNKHYRIKEKVGNKTIYIRKDMVNASKSL